MVTNDALEVDTAEQFFAESVSAVLSWHIPQREILEHKSAHMWVNKRCLEAIADKNSSVGSEEFAAKAAVCSDVLLGQYFAHIKRMRIKLLG